MDPQPPAPTPTTTPEPPAPEMPAPGPQTPTPPPASGPAQPAATGHESKGSRTWMIVLAVVVVLAILVYFITK